MPRKKRRSKKPEEQHTHLSIRVDEFDAEIEVSVSSHVHAPQYMGFYDEDDPLLEPTTYLRLRGTCTAPKSHAGHHIDLTVSSGVDR